MTDEKRKFSRVPFPIAVRLAGNNTAVDGSVRDLSIKGLFVVTEQRPKAGTAVEVEMRLSEAGVREFIRLRGEIVREEPDGVAVGFREMDLDSFGHLKNIVMYNNDGKIDNG